MILRALTSLKLTLALLIALAVISVVGTLKPEEAGRYDLFYQSVWFRSVLALLALHVCVCAVKTIARNLKDRRRFLQLLGTERVFEQPMRYVLPGDCSPDDVAKGLRGLGYRVDQCEDRVYARRNPWGRWGSTIVHLSVVGIMLGALLAETGFIGTLKVYVGEKSKVYQDRQSREDRSLPFEIRLDTFEPIYYPITLRFGVEDEMGRHLKAYEVREGEAVRLPMEGYSAKLVKFLPSENLMALALYHNGRYLGEYRASAKEKRYEGQGRIPMSFVPIAYEKAHLKQVRSNVSILEGGQVVRQGMIQINHPMTYRGVSIHQAAFDRDRFGTWYAAFRLSREPGEPVVWVGCFFMVLGLGIAFLTPFRAVGAGRVDGELVLVALAGFGTSAGGQAAFDKLERRLADSLGS